MRKKILESQKRYQCPEKRNKRKKNDNLRGRRSIHGSLLREKEEEGIEVRIFFFFFFFFEQKGDKKRKRTNCFHVLKKVFRGGSVIS